MSTQPSESAAKAELLRRLGRLVRGLSALFWGLPLTLLVYIFQTARTDFFDAMEAFAILPAICISALLVYGLVQIGYFQSQERIWQTTVERAKIFGIVNVGLSPFLFWWHRFPYVQLYQLAILLLGGSSLLFLFILNRVLHRLAAMLPDETLRLETKLFTTFNRRLLLTIPCLLIAYVILGMFPSLPDSVSAVMIRIEAQGLWVLMFLILMPLAMTMALIWKIKEVVFASILETDR